MRIMEIQDDVSKDGGRCAECRFSEKMAVDLRFFTPPDDQDSNVMRVCYDD